VNLKDNVSKEVKTTSPFDVIEQTKNQRVQSYRGERFVVDNRFDEREKEITILK
jgi:hypothetical protein